MDLHAYKINVKMDVVRDLIKANNQKCYVITTYIAVSTQFNNSKRLFQILRTNIIH